MKCPKCSYVSHDYLNACRKCHVDLHGFKSQMQLYAVEAGHIDLRSVLNVVHANPMESGETPGLFIDPILVESQSQERFDIYFENDVSFTPSGMSLESLDGVEVSSLEAMGQEHQHIDTLDRSEIDAPETGYATVMMDISGMSDENQPSASSTAIFDIPSDLADSTLDVPLTSSEDPVDPRALTVEEAVVERDPKAAEPHALANESNLWLDSEPDAAELQGTLPESFRAEETDLDTLHDESSDFTFPSVEADFSAAEKPSSSDYVSEASFTMPALPDFDPDEQPVSPISEEISFDIDTLSIPEPPPMELPSPPSIIFSVPEPEEATVVYDVSSDETSSHDAPPPSTSSTTYELDISDIQASDESEWPTLPAQTDALMKPSPDEATIVDELSPFASTDHNPSNFTNAPPHNRSETLELEINEPQSPESIQPNAENKNDEVALDALASTEQPPKNHD